MGSSRLCFVVLALASCGRWGFDDHEAPSPDAPAAALLPCGQPARFVTGTSTASVLAATATASGFALLTVESGALAGWSLDWQGDSLAATARRVPLGVETRDVVGAAAIGSKVVAASVYGAPSPLGTMLYPILAPGGSLALRGPAVARGEIGGARPIAKCGTSDSLALVTVDAATAQVDVREISTLGESSGLSRMVVAPIEQASSVSIGPAGSGYLASWTSRAGTPNVNRLALLDASLGIVAGPVSTNTTAFNAIRGHAVWASSPDRYLVAWFEKTMGGGDDVWYQIRGPNLEVITTAQRLAPEAHSPVIASDGSSFWVAWVDASVVPERLAAANVSPSGVVTPRAMPSAGGVPNAWTMVTRSGQSVLVWIEGADLYLDPMCP